MRGADAVLQVCSSKQTCRQVQQQRGTQAGTGSASWPANLVPLAERWLLQRAAKHTQHPPTRRHHAPSKSAWLTFHGRGRGPQCGMGPTLRGRAGAGKQSVQRSPAHKLKGHPAASACRAAMRSATPPSRIRTCPAGKAGPALPAFRPRPTHQQWCRPRWL